MDKTYHYDIDQYKFELFIGDDGYRWDDEGVLQPVKLSLNGHYVISNNWGTQHNLDVLMRKSRSDSGLNIEQIHSDQVSIYYESDRLDLSTGPYKDDPRLIIYGEQYTEFMVWIRSCLAPKEERIKIKIDKILSKL